MNSIKRIAIATVLGLSGGVLAVWMSLGIGATLPPEVITRMLLNFALLGLVIGASALRWHWAINGLFFGMVLGALEGLASVETGLPLFVPLVYGLIVGLLIDFMTSVVFKAGVKPWAGTAAL